MNLARISAFLFTACLVVACNKTESPKLMEIPEGHFRIAMPDVPQRIPSTFNTPLGPMSGANYIARSPDGKMAFCAAYLVYPDIALEKHTTDWWLDSGRDGMIKTLQGTLTRETQIQKDGYPGREAVGNIPSLGIVFGRLYVVGHTYYQISVIASPDKIASPEVENYLNSFSFDKPQ